MAISAICNKNVITIDRNTTLRDVSHLMQKEHVGSVIVTESYSGKKIPAGIITDRDLALAIGASKNPQDILVDQIMRSQPITVNSEDGIYETALKMKKFGVKRMPVLNHDGTLYGVVCADDIYKLMSEELNYLAQITDVQIDIERGIRMPEEKHVQL